MDLINQVLTSEMDVTFLMIGLILIILAIVIGVFKQYWLIGGVNAMPKKELAKMDLDYLVKWFGIFLGAFGLIILLSPFIFRYLDIMKCYVYFFMISTLAFIAFLLLYFNVFKKNRLYKKK